jgi:transcription elongation GreA/GreB family factor
MNVAVNPLQPALDLLREMFPEPKPLTVAERQQIADADKEAAERDQLRAEYVAKRRVELVGRYWRDDEKVDEAFAYAAERVSVGMRVAFRNDDTAELGRMVKARMGLYMHDQATADAEVEGYNLFPVAP